MYSSVQASKTRDSAVVVDRVYLFFSKFEFSEVVSHFFHHFVSRSVEGAKSQVWVVSLRVTIILSYTNTLILAYCLDRPTCRRCV